MRKFFREALTALIFASAGLACREDGSPLAPIEEPPDAGCLRAEEPQTYEVYFVIDVSGSMGPFLNGLKTELVAFANGFSEFDSSGSPVRVDYYVVAFVNDVKWYGGRMTSVIALQEAFDQAIARGETNQNLNQNRINSEREENTLDAITEVLERSPSADAKLLLVAGDAPFVEAPAILSDGIRVRSTYASVRAGLEAAGMRVHAFVPEELDGLSRSYAGMPALTALPGSSVHSLRDLSSASEQIRETLLSISSGAACN